MKQFIYLSAICILALSACTTGAFKKGADGLEYKLISSGSGKAIPYGSFMQIHLKQVYAGDKDSVLMDSRDYMSRIQLLDSISMPPAYFNILKQMKKGDSLVIRLLTDSAFKNSQQGMPPFAKKGKYMYTYVSLINVFENRDQADSANKAETILAKPRIYKKQLEEIEKDLASQKVQLDADGKMIEAYLAKNNIKAEKTKWGTYVAITTEGTGNKLTADDIASVNYTGRTLDSGRVFDSNLDPKFNHVEIFDVNLGQLGSVIPGWTDALLQFKKGTKATVYIPSSLAYGPGGRGETIKPNENLIFDMEVVNVLTEVQLEAKQKLQQEEMMKKMQENQDKNPAAPKQPGK